MVTLNTGQSDTLMIFICR